MPQRVSGGRDAEIRRRVAGRVRRLLEGRPDGSQTQAWLARQVPGGKGTVLRLLRLEKPITIELVESLAAAFSVHPVHFLCEGSEPLWDLDPDAETFKMAVRQRFVDRLDAALERWETTLQPTLSHALIRSVSGTAKNLLELEMRLRALAADPDVDVRSITIQNEWEQWVRETAGSAEEAAEVLMNVEKVREIRRRKEGSDG